MNKASGKSLFLLTGIFLLALAFVYVVGYTNLFTSGYKWMAADIKVDADSTSTSVVPPTLPPKPVLNIADYDSRLLALAHRLATTTKLATSTASTTATTTVKKYLWPVKTVYPNGGAILPFKRIVAYYGNFYSKGMGVLGQYPESQMLAMLRDTAVQWAAADPTTPVLPAIDYIAVTAQGSAGKDGKYRLRMPDSQVDYALQLADKVNGIVILDIQVGLSDLPAELPLLEKYFALPNVHLAIDPEFAMHNGERPGTVIGTMDASDINYAAKYLAALVKANNLPPKILIVHRFTEDMVTNYQLIKPLPEVQIIMDMDGWGNPPKKKNTYLRVIQNEPVQFTGFKLFYKNDLLPPSTRMMTETEVLAQTPTPVFIQYQ